MGNSLTGDFDAVLEISVRQINGLLATIHQNSVDKDATPSFLHSSVIRVGDEGRRIDPYQIETYGWLVSSGGSFLAAKTEEGATSLDLTKLPPGAGEKLAADYADWINIWAEPAPADVVRGKAQVQISTPLLTVAHESTSELTVSVFIRAHYEPDLGSKSLPGPVHGEVRVTYQVSKVDTASGPKLKVVPPSQDNKIRFIPKPGTLSAGEAEVIAGEIRKATRAQFQPTEVHLPEGFSFSAFKGLAGNASDPATQSLALPLSISGEVTPEGEVVAPVGEIDSIPGSLLDGSDFALGVSKEYVNRIFQPQLDSLRSVIQGIRVTHSITVLGVSVSATYVPQLISGPSISWKDGGFELSLGILAHTDSRAPDANIHFGQGISLSLDASTQNVVVYAVGEPSVSFALTSLDSVIPSSTKDEIKAGLTGVFKNARDEALRAASSGVSSVFAQALQSFRAGLHSFDERSGAKFRTLHVTADGIVVRGEISTAERNPPFVHFHEKDGCYNALESWVPGGRVKKCNWGASGIVTRIFDGTMLVQEHTSNMPVSFGTDARGFDSHGFVRSKPDLGAHKSYSQVCLTVEGSQISPNGKLIEGDDISGFYSIGGSCIPTLPEPIIVLPPGWNKLLIPDWERPGPVEVPMEKYIIRHFDAVSDVPLDPDFATNTLIFFADWNSPRPLAGLARALEPANRRNVSLSVVVVLPEGSLKLSRLEFDERMGFSDGALPVQVGDALPPVAMQFAEDLDAAWTSTFGVKGNSASVIVNARGEFAWKKDGAVEPAEFREALQFHALPAAAPRSRLIQSGPRPGDSVPDAYFEDDRGEFTALRRMRGRSMILNFWQSRSQPSVAELGRLQGLHEKGGRNAPFIVAHAGDKDVKVLNEMKQANKLTFALAHDANGTLARQFRVRCWPTTLSINPDGIIDHVQYGTAPAGRAVQS